ncbi:hypothetical protein FXO37_14441 [Capsicum annuum]|nr:hypothetical protein FXO37_14441 [Capsicum annuum]
MVKRAREVGETVMMGTMIPSMPSLSRFISVEWYDLRTIIEEVGSFLTKISFRSRMAAYQEFKRVLVDQELKKRFKRSCFGHLRNLLENLKFNGQLNYPWGQETFQLALDYLKKKSDLKKHREVFDEKKMASYALFKFPWAFMVWMYEAFPHLEKFTGKSMDFPIPLHVDLCELERNEKEDDDDEKSKMDKLASVMAEEEKKEQKKDEEKEMKEDKSQEESVKEAAAAKEEKVEKEAVAIEEEGKEKGGDIVKQSKEKEEAKKIRAAANEEEEEPNKEEADKAAACEKEEEEAAKGEEKKEDEEEKKGQKEAVVKGDGKKEGEEEKQDGFMDIIDEINNKEVRAINFEPFQNCPPEMSNSAEFPLKVDAVLTQAVEQAIEIIP